VDKVFTNNDIANINRADISGAFITLTAGLSLTLEDYTLLGDLIELKVSEDCIIVIGTVLEPSFDEIKQVSVVFTGPELY
jgi:cell division protein FtsZ